MTKPKKPPRSTPKPAVFTAAQDRERVHAEALESHAGPVWQALRASFPEAIRQTVDRLAFAELKLTLADLKILALATERLVASRADEAWAMEEFRASAQLTSIQLQYQKQLRHICTLEGPGLALGDQPVRVPEGMMRSDFDALRKELAEDPDEIKS